MAAKSYAKTDSRAREEEHVNFGVTDYPLTVMTLLFLTSNSSASHRLRSKVLEFLEMLDPRDYAANQDVNWRLALARAVGAAVMRGGAKVLAAVEHRVLEDMEWADWHEQFFAAYKTSSGHVAEGAIIENELSDADVQYVDEYVSTRLRYAYLWTARTFLRDVADRIDAVDLGEISRFNDEVMERMERIVQRGRQARALLATEGQDFSTGDVSFEAALRATWEARNKPQSVVRSGLRLLNDMLGGGYEGGRVYVYFALSGGGKSGVLAMSALWACDQRFNPEFRTKDPTKTPCVVYLSQENDLYETIERMISFALGSDVDLRHVEQEDLVRTMEAALSSPTCKFIFKYRPSRSISTADMEAMIHDEYMRGNEVVMFVQDYIKRIRAVENFRDQRHLELGAIVDEFGTIAKRHAIPVITGMQLNRDAYAKVEAALRSGKTDAVKELGANNVGESINVYENSDCVIFLNKVTSEALGRTFMTFRRAKMRGKRKSGADFFAQPFELDRNEESNEMRLVADQHLTVKECRGRKDIAEGIQQMYDPATHAQPGGLSSEDRRADRVDAVLSGETGGRRSSDGKKRKTSSPTRLSPNGGVARLETVPDSEASAPAPDGFAGL